MKLTTSTKLKVLFVRIPIHIIASMITLSSLTMIKILDALTLTKAYLKLSSKLLSNPGLITWHCMRTQN